MQTTAGEARPSEVLAHKREAVRARLSEFGVVSAGVFGSVARGEDTLASDLDLIVDFEPAHERDLVGLELALLELLGTPVDVVDARSVWARAKSTGVGYTILNETVPL